MRQNFYRHGVRQLRSTWFDGPAYITQCPIQPDQSYLYNFTITGQRGTLFWHAHISWMRSTVHGAFIIRPKPHHNYPFPTPIAEIPVVLGTKQLESHSQFQNLTGNYVVRLYFPKCQPNFSLFYQTPFSNPKRDKRGG